MKRGSLHLPGGARMDWCQLGHGSLPVVVIPGAGDGLWRVGQSAPLLAWRYHRRWRSNRLLILGRREPIPPGFTVADHADDYVNAVDQLGWEPSVWECTSAGGPIGQQAAWRRPDLVRGLILASTTHRADTALRSVLKIWQSLARARLWHDLYQSMADLNRPSTAAWSRVLRPLLRFLPGPRSPWRFIRLLDGLTELDHRAIVLDIQCPVLVIGGEDDRIITADLQREMASLFRNSRLVLYKGLGHAAPMDHPGYEITIKRFMDEIYR